MRPMWATHWFAGLCLALAAGAWGAQDDLERRVFPLEEVSGLDERSGHFCACSEQADPNMTYPAFSSGKPLYGLMRVDMEFGEEQSGTPYRFAIDESGGIGAGYDRLYVDLNLDGSLADESPVLPLQKPPESVLLKGDWIVQQVCFDSIVFSSTDPATAVHAMPTLPRLTLGNQGQRVLAFIATGARKGEIVMARRRFDVTLVNSYPLGTRWDRPGTIVKLESRRGAVNLPTWWGADRLIAMPEFGGTWWHLATTPAGDQLIVEPYRGDFGALTVGSARGFVWSRTVVGSLRAKDKAVAVGDNSDGYPKPVSIGTVPVGRYLPALLTVRYGPLLVQISENYHSDGKPRQRETPPVPMIEIRKDRTFVLDFSRRPEVLFASPAPGTRLKAGDELKVMAVLVDPKLDVMIRGLRRKPYESLPPGTTILFLVAIAGPFGLWLFMGKARRKYRLLPVFSAVVLVLFAGCLAVLYYLNVALGSEKHGTMGFDELTPSVAISRTNGAVLTRGVMPFG